MSTYYNTYSAVEPAISSLSVKTYKKLFLTEEDIDNLKEKFPFDSFKFINELESEDLLGYRVLGRASTLEENIIKFSCTEDAFLENFSGILLGNIGLVLVEERGYDAYSSDPDIILELLSDLVKEAASINSSIKNDPDAYKLFNPEKFWDTYSKEQLEDILRYSSLTTTGDDCLMDKYGCNTAISTLTPNNNCDNTIASTDIENEITKD